MTKLSWFQRIFIKEVVGRITNREFGYRGIIKEPVTLYEITQSDKKVYRGALLGHQYTPQLDDKVEIYLEKGNSIAQSQELKHKTNTDGSVEVVTESIYWAPIKRFRVLEDLV